MKIRGVILNSGVEPHLMPLLVTALFKCPTHSPSSSPSCFVSMPHPSTLSSIKLSLSVFSLKCYGSEARSLRPSLSRQPQIQSAFLPMMPLWVTTFEKVSMYRLWTTNNRFMQFSKDVRKNLCQTSNDNLTHTLEIIRKSRKNTQFFLLCCSTRHLLHYDWRMTNTFL